MRGRCREQGARPALLTGEGHVQAIDAQREADGGQAAPEAPEQLVVAPAAADRGAELGVVHVEHGARVVADVAHEAEVEDDALGDVGLEQLVDLAQAGDSLGDRAHPVGEHLGPAATLGHVEQQLGGLPREPRLGEPRSSPTKSRSTSVSRSAGRTPTGTPRLAISAGNSEASPRPTR